MGTELTYGACVGGLFGLWALFRTMVVVSLSLQDRACQMKDAMDTRNAKLGSDKNNTAPQINNQSFM